MKTGEDAGAHLEALWQGLGQSISDRSHKLALQAAHEILGLQPKDEDAYRAKLAALLQLSEWEKALQLITKSTGAGGSLQFEKAYCLYRMGKIEEALTTVSSLLPGGAGAAADNGQHTQQALELAAQLQHRLGRSKECIQLYDLLLQQYKADDLELKTNILAAYVAAGLSKEVPDLMAAMKITPKSSFEVGFNKACSLVEVGDFAAAELELKLAIKLGRETLFEEELTEKEVEEELAPLMVQLAYVLGRLGRTAEAQELHDKVLQLGGSPDDLGSQPTKALAANNAFADAGRVDALPAHRKSVAGAAKKLEAMLADASKPGSTRLAKGLESRFSYAQSRLLHLNRGLAYLLAERLPAAKEVAAAIASEDSRQQVQANASVQPQWTGAHLLPLLQAAIACKEDKPQEADALLASAVSSHGYTPYSAVHLLLAQTQLALESGDTRKGTELLSRAAAVSQEAGMSGGLGPRGGSPALLATSVALHQRLGDLGSAESLLESALTAWKGSPGQAADSLLSTTGVSWCLEALAALKLKLGKVTEAEAALQQLQSLGVNTASVLKLLAQLLRALASTDPSKEAASLVQRLPSIVAETKGIDVDALEENTLLSARRAGGDIDTAGRPAEASGQKRGAASMEVDGVDEEKKRVKKKRTHKKKPRLPKGFDPNLPNGALPHPDPERWLPKWERSDFKKKKKKSAARERDNKGGGAQGSGKVDDSLDRTKNEGPKPKPQPPPGKAKKGKR